MPVSDVMKGIVEVVRFPPSRTHPQCTVEVEVIDASIPRRQEHNVEVSKVTPQESWSSSTRANGLADSFCCCVLTCLWVDD